MIDDIIDNVLVVALNLVHSLIQFLTAKKDDDLYDRMSSRITSFMLVVLAIVMVVAQFIIKPIVCWCPTHFTDAHIDYTNNLCWVKNTYYLPFNEAIPKPGEDRQFIRYYQFIIFILVGQAILYFLPSVVWHGMNSKAGIDSDDILHKAGELKCLNINNSESKFNKLNYIVQQFKYLFGKRNRNRFGSTHGPFGRVCMGIVHFCGGRFNCYLVCVFLFTKILYIINAVGQFWLLNIVLFNRFNLYGFEVLGNVVADHNWHNAPFDAFPRVTMCDLKARRLGNLHRYTVQCTLPLNYLNEKVYMFLWFWMALVAAVTVFGFLQWMLRTTWPGDDVHFISNHLIDFDQYETEKIKRFIARFLKSDGVFLLRLISHNTNTLTTNDITCALYEKWNQETNEIDNKS